MLSRRNVRIKAMQILYAANRDAELSYQKIENRYKQGVDKSYQTYLFNLYFLYKIAYQSKKDLDIRKVKLLPGEDDRKFQAILVTNPLMNSLADHTGFFNQLQKFKVMSRVNSDYTRELYNAFAESEGYLEYATKEKYTNKEHMEMLLSLYRFCIKQELFYEGMDEVFSNWEDDESLVVGATKKTLKKFPVDEFFYKEFIPDYETVEEYGQELLYKVYHLDADLLEIIEPYLQNWEADRVAILDMILLKMAIVEFLHFPTIPTKVTINEYIDISKLYSTPKSKDFINGILDRMLKKMTKDGTIQKSGRGLKG